VKLKITVDDKTYEVEVAVSEPDAPPPPRGYVVEPAPVRIVAAPAGAPSSGATVDEDKVCRSPIAGTVARVAAQAGQSIQPGDVLLVLEAMKMETSITAPLAGKIRGVTVNVGDSVRSGQVLVELE
jgi:biotin carboxyl carrier protein